MGVHMGPPAAFGKSGHLLKRQKVTNDSQIIAFYLITIYCTVLHILIRF